MTGCSIRCSILGLPSVGDVLSPARRVDVLGIEISAITFDQALDELQRRVAQRDDGYFTFTGVHGVIESQHNAELVRIHNDAALTCPDGMPMVWAARRAGAAWTERVYGPDFMLAACEQSVEPGWRHFFYGGGEGVAELLTESLVLRFPGLQVAGTYTPPFRDLDDGEVVEVVEVINAARPDIVWVGLSTPKQERWMARVAARVDAPVLLGVGAAFDMNAGLLPQAPDWMQGAGLEWAYRLAREPRRLWRRYLANNPRFLVGVVRHPPHLVVR